MLMSRQTPSGCGGAYQENKKRAPVLLADDCLPLVFAEEEESESRRAVGGLVNVS